MNMFDGNGEAFLKSLQETSKMLGELVSEKLGSPEKEPKSAQTKPPEAFVTFKT